MIKTKYFALSVTALLALGAGCTSTTTTNANANTNTTDTTITNNGTVLEVPVDPNSNVNETVIEAEDTTQEFDISAAQFEFTPSTITVQKGDTVTLNLSSKDVPHGFSLSAYNISETLTSGKITTVKFVADQAGTFNFTCNVVCGAGHSGMSGQLIVEE